MKISQELLKRLEEAATSKENIKVTREEFLDYFRSLAYSTEEREGAFKKGDALFYKGIKVICGERVTLNQ